MKCVAFRWYEKYIVVCAYTTLKLAEEALAVLSCKYPSLAFYIQDFQESPVDVPPSAYDSETVDLLHYYNGEQSARDY